MFSCLTSHLVPLVKEGSRLGSRPPCTWVALLLLVCLIADQSDAVALSRYGRSDGSQEEPSSPARRAVLSRYGRAVLSRYGKRSAIGGRYGKRGENANAGDYLLCKYTGVSNQVDCLPLSEALDAM